MDAQTRQILTWAGEPEKAESHFYEFTSAYQDKTQKKFDFESVNAKRLATLFGNSNFLTRFLVRHPKEANLLVDSPFIEIDKTLPQFEKELKHLLGDLKHCDKQTLIDRLIFFKYRELLRLTVKDLSQAANLQSILQEISSLAEALVRAALRHTQKTLEEKFKKIAVNFEEDLKNFSVIAMGKLGGKELNYSSDIDLQYLYGATDQDLQSEISGHEFHIKLAQELTQILSAKNENGFLYRVDLNLRPEGRSGILANSLGALETYYESFGEEWERQALLKAKPIAGDFDLGGSFLEMIEPFVWRRHIGFETIEKMKEMKRKVHDSVKKGPTRGFHVKLDEGGIREIEFFTQTLQLLYGGLDRKLRAPSTLAALEALAAANHLQPRDAKQLKEAYLFLRQTEHRLQMVDELQTHTIPLAAVEQQALARRMGYFEEDPLDARERFLEDLMRYTTMVKETFANLFQSGD